MSLPLVDERSRSRALTLPQPLDAIPRRTRLGVVGSVGYYASGAGNHQPPLVLVHGIDPLASSSQVEPLVSAFPERRRFALDWPGFGISERRARTYNPELYSLTLSRFIQAVASPDGIATDVVALGLGAEFAARTALEYPSLIRSLVLVSPTGLGRTPSAPVLPAAILETLERYPRVADLTLNMLSSSPGIRLWLGRLFHGPVDAKLAQHAKASARQPDARHAPLAWLKGSLSTDNADEYLYRALRVPSIVLYDSDVPEAFERLPLLTRNNPFVRAAPIQGTRGMPHFEHSEVVEQAMRAFYASIDATEHVESRVITVPIPRQRQPGRAATLAK